MPKREKAVKLKLYTPKETVNRDLNREPQASACDAGLGALQGESLSFDPEVSGPKGRMNPAYEVTEFVGWAPLPNRSKSLRSSGNIKRREKLSPLATTTP